jgi:hypothetical protein
MSLPAFIPRLFDKAAAFRGELTRINSAGQFKPFVYLNGPDRACRDRDQLRRDRDGSLSSASRACSGSCPKKKSPASQRDLPFTTLCPKLTAGVLLLLTGLLAAALLLAGLLTRALILLTRLLLARLVLILAGHLGISLVFRSLNQPAGCQLVA